MMPSVANAALRQLKSLVASQVDVTPLLRAPSSHLRKLTNTIGQNLPEVEEWLRQLGGRLADELESRPERLLSLACRSSRWMAKGLVADLPRTREWLDYFRAVERALPGAVVLANARATVRLAGRDDERFTQLLARIPPPPRGECSGEEYARRELDWLGKVIEGVFAPGALDALSFVESLRTGKAFFRMEARGGQYEQVIESLRTAPVSPSLDGDLFRIRNAIEHDSFQVSEASFVLSGKKGKSDWVREIAFEYIGPKGQDVLLTAAAIALSMHVVMIESAPALILHPAMVKVLVAALRGLDTKAFNAEAEAAFTSHLRETLLQLERIG
jgi:hypothetical protein